MSNPAQDTTLKLIADITSRQSSINEGRGNIDAVWTGPLFVASGALRQLLHRQRYIEPRHDT